MTDRTYAEVKMRDLISDNCRVYSKLSDEYSKLLYEKRVMYSLTGDCRYIKEIIGTLPEKRIADEKMNKMIALKDKLVIWGAGDDYGIMNRLYGGWECICFVDRAEDKQKKPFFGKKVISPEEFYSRYADYYVAVNSTAWHREIVENLSIHDIPEEHIIDLGEQYYSLYKKQYFDPDIIVLRNDEVFVDGGAFNGATSELFHQLTGGKYNKIIAFEPGKQNVRAMKLRGVERKIANMELVEKGLWSAAENISFSGDGTQGGKISSSESGYTISTVCLDSLPDATDITFIKLDVEGAELEALKGARNTIIKNHPKLAICLYHQPEDIFEIPAYILSLYDGYRFYIRHYQLSECETVLYAV